MTAGNDRPIGFGRMTRKEDARFIRGQGTFVDDVQLPGMLHGAMLRSPFAHARIVAIDTTAALQHPKVQAVITGADLQARGLAWMPTLSGDTQAVLATDKVRFQGQEIAFVVADDRYAARDALELIEVTYEELPVVVDPRAAIRPDAPVIRDDKPDAASNRIFDWEAGDRATTEAVFARADVVVKQEMLYPRSHPAPMETCGALASFEPVSDRLTLWCTTQAPHAHRTFYALLTGLAEHKIRVISPDIGGGFGNKVPVYPGYVCAIIGSIVTGHPVKWMEDRSENLMASGFARDYLMKGKLRRLARARSWRCAPTCSPITVRSTPRHSRPSSPPDSSECSPAPTSWRRLTATSAARTPTRPRGVSATRVRSASPRPCTWSSGWSTAWPTSCAWTRRNCAPRT